MYSQPLATPSFESYVEPVLVDYAGAGARLAPERGLSLSPARWGWQPKVDGAYVRVSTDRHGRVSSLVHRSGRLVSTADADGLVGLYVGLPDSVLAGEFEAHTEAGLRARAARGWAAVHLFDASVVAGRSVAAEPYSARYGWLHRWQAWLECYEPPTDWWTTDSTGRAHDAQGRFTRPVPSDMRRFPVVPLHRGKGAGEALWRAHVELGGGEGVVAVRLDAPLGQRGGKRKVKATDTLDATVLAAQGGSSMVLWRGYKFAVGGNHPVGATVEIAHDGWYEAGVVPRFPRVRRVRYDVTA